ncbi:MAG: trpS [Candidatus Saccharibacteria bacterium]|nr:trpS [Candidatus Saccharibacteria bacterium]
MSKPVILTGIRANNDLTLGNYFGGILPIIDMAKTKSDEYQINMFIPDLHSFTTPIDHAQLYEQILHNARLFVAAGLPVDSENIYLYRQSQISAHSELTWILDCFTGFGALARMTQFKDKGRGILQSDFTGKLLDANGSLIAAWDARGQEVTAGLFNYPVLMAGDILLYGAQYVPVGDDQSQHLEFTRDIAERMNKRFGDIFAVPEPVAKQHEFFGNDQGLRIKDLIDPTKKMSKSDDSGRGVIFLGDDPDAAAKKVMSATTDDKAAIHFDKANQPGISNLLEILSLLRSRPRAETIAEFEGQSSYGDFKAVVAEEVKAFLIDFQLRLASVSDDQILTKLETSETAMRLQANQTLLRAQRAVGLRPKED